MQLLQPTIPNLNFENLTIGESIVVRRRSHTHLLPVLDQEDAAAIDDREEDCHYDHHILKAIAFDPRREGKNQGSRDCEFYEDNSNETVGNDLTYQCE